jgi:uncharacterized membrane protein
LLVTTLATGSEQWSSWSAFRHAIGGPIFAYALSFVVVSSFWWANHQFVSSLKAMSPRVIGTTIIMLGFVVLLPFSTAGLGAGPSDSEVATVVYAVNVAAVSMSVFLMFRVALAERLFNVAPSKEEILERTVRILDAPFVFLASVPVALFWSASAAKYVWLLLIVTVLLELRWFARRQRSRS